MAAPVITTKNPGNLETGVYLDQRITITFDQAIDEATIDDNTIVIYRTSDYVIIFKSFSYDSSTFTVTLTPDTVFTPNTTFNVVVVGADQSTTSIKNASGEALAATANWYFTTGTALAPAPQPSIEEAAEAEAAAALPDMPYAGSPVVKVLSPQAVAEFAVTDTNPDNYATNLGTNPSGSIVYFAESGITISFNHVMPSGVDVDQNWVVLSAESVVGDPSVEIGVPSGVLSNTLGGTLTWTPGTLDATNSWHLNNEITVTISKDTVDVNGNALGCDYQFMFTTKYRPLYSSAKAIRAIIGPFLRDVSDDAINRIIHINSSEAYNLANVIYAQNQWGIDSPTFAAKQWVFCKSQYDLLYAKVLDVAGTRPGQIKRLGDFTIQEGLDIQKGLQGAIDKALACANAWLVQLLGKSRRAKSKMVIKGINNASTPLIRGIRTWTSDQTFRSPYPTGNAPGIGANQQATRRIKLPGIYDAWS